jgi:hypothetical protein
VNSDDRKLAASIGGCLIWAIWILVLISFWVAVIWAGIHFAHKYW